MELTLANWYRKSSNLCKIEKVDQKLGDDDIVE